MSIPKQNRARDSKYRKHLSEQPCWACGAKDGTVVGSHQSIGSYARGLKASDEYLMACCMRCHDVIDGRAGTQKERLLALGQVLNTLLRNEYWKWRGDI